MAETNAEGVNVCAVAETTQGDSPPPTSGWLNLEADAIGDPGPAYKKMARTPFTITRPARISSSAPRREAMPARAR